MAEIVLKRIMSGTDGTAGAIIIDGWPVCVALERPWEDNKRNVSCIPPGTYPCTKERHGKFGTVLRLHDVKGRGGILLHSGNTIDDSRGCILPGLSFGLILGRHAVLDSKKAKALIMSKLDADERHTFEVRAVGG